MDLFGRPVGLEQMQDVAACEFGKGAGAFELTLFALLVCLLRPITAFACVPFDFATDAGGVFADEFGNHGLG